MQPYPPTLKHNARALRAAMTDAEQLLWFRLRRKQLRGIQFYRQKPVGPYIVDFYTAQGKLVIALDGSQHYTPEGMAADKQRDAFLTNQGLLVLRFNNLQVIQELDGMLAVIDEVLGGRLAGEQAGESARRGRKKIPLPSPFCKGGN